MAGIECVLVKEGPGVLVGDISRMLRHSDGDGSACLANVCGRALLTRDRVDRANRMEGIRGGMRFRWLRHALVRCKSQHKRESRLKNLPRRNLFKIQRKHLSNANGDDNADILILLFVDQLPFEVYTINGRGALEAAILAGIGVGEWVLHFRSIPDNDRAFSLETPDVLFWNHFNETSSLIKKAFEDEILSRTQVYFWYKRFKDGRISIADNSRSGRPLTSITDRNIGQRSSFDQVSEFDRGRIVAYRNCTLSFREIGSRVGRNQTTVMQICDRWMQEGTTDRRVRSHTPQCTTLPAERQIVRIAMTDRSFTSRTLAQHIQSVTHHSVSARTIRRRLKQSGLSSRRPLLRLPLTQNHRRLRRPMMRSKKVVDGRME
ncbi:hypothetical protein LAZ67_22000593 [Cordylochernes scorpioides]|uniref:Transposase Tc1-like domain-containing protein n=1 Tax=Cordylochernes scorpioides TaxID=51811 RepID=A0ABY6LRC0_9ARAC|nr:hypothetical protein LAZ67_22000593 [Cordylochernes scorpioides]